MEILQQIVSALAALVMALSSQIASLPPSSQLAQVSAPTSGLVGYWNFDEGSGTTVNDSSGNGNTGTINGATWVAGKIGSGALSFDGTSSYVSLGSPSSLTNITYPYSISLWFKTSVNQSKILFSFDTNDASSDQAILLANSSGGNNQWIIAGNKYANVYPTINNLSDGQWHNVVIERDSSNNALIYVDGNNFSTTNTSAYSVSGLVIGARGTGTYSFNGSIDDVRIYNRALSAQEVSDIYSSSGGTVAPPVTPPVNPPVNPPSSDTQAPTVPSNLSATAVSSSQINLSWSAPTDNVGVTGYKIFRNSSQVGTTANTSYNDTNLSASTNYSYTVSAYDAAGNNGSQSSSASATTQVGTNPPSSNGTYSVKQDGTGDFTTIQACANTVKAGETCLVYAGTYPERVSTASGGTSDGNRVTFKTQGAVTMRGFDVKHPYITIDGFDMTGYPTNYTGYVDVWQNGDYVKVLNNIIRDVDSGAKVNGIRFERVSGDSANNGIIRGNTMTHLNSQYFSLHGSNHLIEQNVMTEARQWDPFYIFGSNHIIRQNIFSNPGAPGGGNHPDYFQTFSSGGESTEHVLIENNWIQDLPDQLCQLNSSVDGVGDLVTNVQDFTFRGNVVVNVPSNCNLDIPNTTWENNTFYRLAYNLTGIIMGGSLTRGNGASARFRNNVFLGGGSNNSNGFYSVDGFLFTREVIAQYVTGEGFASCSSPGCPIANGITNDMVANNYIDGAYNGHILAAARTLSSINDMKLNSAYAAYKLALWDKLQQSITYDNTLKSTFYADYNYVGGAPSAGYPAKKSSGCVAGATYTSGNFCESHGINGGSPMLKDVNNPLGSDGIPFTLDDGLKPQSGSPLCGKGDSGNDIGAYSCSSNTVLSGVSNNPIIIVNPPNNPPITPANSLVLKLDFENYNPASGTLSDKSNTGNNGSCNYALGQCPIIGTGANGSTAGGFFGLYPDAQNDGDYIAVSKSDSLSNLAKGTVSVWARYASTGSDRSEFILDTYQKTGEDTNKLDIGTPGTWALSRNFYQNNNLWIFNNSGSRVQALIFPDSQAYKDAQLGTAGWHHYAFTWDGSNIKGYYDGNLFGTTPQTNFSYLTLGYYLAIGASGHNSPPEYGTQKYPNHGFLNGYIDDVRIYNYALSDTDVSALYNNSSMSTPPPATPTLPVISNLVGSNTSSSSTKISWDTNVVTNGQVFYGKTSSYGLSSVLVDNSPKTTSHSIMLSNLSPGTLYHFKVTSTDANNQSVSSSDFAFTTLVVSSNNTDTESTGGNTTTTGNTTTGTGNGSSTSANTVVYIPPVVTSPATTISTTQISGSLTRNLLPASKGDDVKILQNFLASQGYLTADSVTGFFGPLTQKAVQSFQKTQGIVSSGSFWTTGYGMVGPTTRAKINSLLGSSSAAINTSSTLNTATVAPLNRNLSRGSQGSDVTTLQNFLISQGHLAPGNAIGYFGPMTEIAVKKFQAAQTIVSAGTPQTTGYGNVGSITRAKINSMLGTTGTSITPSNADLKAQIDAMQKQVQELLLKLQKTQ